MELVFSIIIAIAVGFGIFLSIKKQGIKGWLLMAVEEAEENILGEKKGQERFSWVYNEFISKFPIISKFISSKDFSNLLENALAEFKNILKDED